jgi:hypothetical protein
MRVQRPGEAALANAEPPPYDCKVDLRGIVYIYNDPSLNEIGTGSAEAPAKRRTGLPSKLVELPRKESSGPQAVDSQR